jgi:hypothetical protein
VVTLLLTMTLAGCTPGLAPPVIPSGDSVTLTPVPENAFVRGADSISVSDPIRGLYGAAGEVWWVDVYRLGETKLAWVRVYLDRSLPVEPPAYVSVRGAQTSADDVPVRWTVTGWEQLPLPAGRGTVEQACAAAIRDNAAAIQRIDLGPLAHPGYQESTAAWHPDATALSNPQPALMAVDAASQRAVCRWQGPTLPHVKPLVTRWLVLYPVYDLRAGRVTRIVVTIEGQVEE